MTVIKENQESQRWTASSLCHGHFAKQNLPMTWPRPEKRSSPIAIRGCFWPSETLSFLSRH
ncbi:hypothetical protein T4D_3979 [Trichinella pseudospiralis]|uniref:Uncharacterized protein n=1 Tax=Trichinella pseudospiralis TaxID=6337 RepID=A0A0V1FBI7_TRIPS|nr:hypothetical protein T4D_3979 [Trichinella pseudospiralis]